MLIERSGGNAVSPWDVPGIALLVDTSSSAVLEERPHTLLEIVNSAIRQTKNPEDVDCLNFFRQSFQSAADGMDQSKAGSAKKSSSSSA